MKEKIKKNYKKILSTFFVVLIAILILFTTKKIISSLEKIVFEDNEVYQIFGEQVFEYKTKFEISNKKGLLKIHINDEEIEPAPTPFYFKDTKKVLFPENMAVIFPLSNMDQRRIPYFSYIEEMNHTYTISNLNLEYPIENAFFYDGNDLYFFIDEVTLTFDNTKINLSPFSFVTYNFNNDLTIYNYESNDAQLYNGVKTAIVEHRNFKLNLVTDSIIYGDKNRLLIKNLSFLDLLKTKEDN